MDPQLARLGPHDRFLFDLFSRQSSVLAHRLFKHQTAPGRGQVDFVLSVDQTRPTVDLLSEKSKQFLGECHQVLVRGIGLVELEQGVLRVMLGRGPLVAEHASQLEDALDTAHDQTLEEQLGRDA